MPDLILTPARFTAGTVKPIASGWVKSVKVAAQTGWLRGRLRSQRLWDLSPAGGLGPRAGDRPPKGSVNVSAVDSIVHLRGQVENPEEIERLISAARRVPGVRTVESLLHAPGAPAPMGGAG